MVKWVLYVKYFIKCLTSSGHPVIVFWLLCLRWGVFKEFRTWEHLLNSSLEIKATTWTQRKREVYLARLFSQSNYYLFLQRGWSSSGTVLSPVAHIRWELPRLQFLEQCIPLVVVVVLCWLGDADPRLTCPAEATHAILTPICVPTGHPSPGQILQAPLPWCFLWMLLPLNSWPHR